MDDDLTPEIVAIARSAPDDRSQDLNSTIHGTAVGGPPAGAGEMADRATGGDAHPRPTRAALPRVAQHVPGYYLG